MDTRLSRPYILPKFGSDHKNIIKHHKNIGTFMITSSAIVMNPLVFLLYQDPLRETSQNLWHANKFSKEQTKGHIHVSNGGSTSGQCDTGIGFTWVEGMHRDYYY